jgi:hypothetical protein
MAKSWALITRILVVGILLAFTSSLAQASTRKTAQYPLPFKPKWVTRLKKGKVFKYRRNEFSSPKVYKGLIFLGTNSSRFYAINKKPFMRMSSILGIRRGFFMHSMYKRVSYFGNLKTLEAKFCLHRRSLMKLYILQRLKAA